MHIARFFKKKLLTRAKRSTSNHSGIANNNNNTLSRFKGFSNNNIRKDFGNIARKNIKNPVQLNYEIQRRDMELNSKINALKHYISVLQDDAKKTDNSTKKQQIENAISKYVDEFTKLTDIQHIFKSRWMSSQNNKKSSRKRSSSKRSGSSKRSSRLSMLNNLKESIV